MGIRGGTAFHAIAGFGRHHRLSEARFVETPGSLAVEVEFLVTEEEADQLLSLVHRERLPLFYAHMPAQFEVMDPSKSEPPAITTGL